MTFKKRYLAEADTPQSVTEKLQDAVKKTNENFKEPAKPQPSVPSMTMASATPAPVSIVKSAEAMSDLSSTSSTDDAAIAGNTLDNRSENERKESSSTPGLKYHTEAAEITIEHFHGPHHNSFTSQIKKLGRNTGVKPSDVNSKDTLRKSGIDNPTMGTEASLTLGGNDVKKQAKDGLKTGSHNVPGRKELKLATESWSVISKINALLEDTYESPWGTNAPGNRKTGRTMSHGVDTSNSSSTKYNDMMNRANDVTKNKQINQAKTRTATMPEIDKSQAMEQTGGLHMQQSSIVHGADEANANVRQQREERMQSKEGQENG